MARLAVGMESRCLPAAFALCRCLSLCHSRVSTPPLIEPDVRVSRIRLSDEIMP